MINKYKSQKNILLDFERMQSLYTGFYYFNLHFGKSVLKLAPANFNFSFYLVQSQFGMFGKGPKYESSRSYSKSKINFLNYFRRAKKSHYDIIHISDQHSRIIPN